MTGRVCSTCKQTLSLDAFGFRWRLDANRKPYSVYHWKCKECRAKYYSDRKDHINLRRMKNVAKDPNKIRDQNLRAKYGISLGQWEQLFESQGRRCAICKCEEPNTLKTWSLDHNHTTGRVRGILCGMCNSMVGYAKESTGSLLSAVDYLLKDKMFYVKPATATISGSNTQPLGV